MKIKIEAVYLTQEEWDSLCKHEPVKLAGQVFPIGRHIVRIVTAEQRETILKLKNKCDDFEKR